MKKLLAVYRNEKKYELSPMESLELQKEMQILLEPDPFSKNGFYHVRSLYFDTINHKDYLEKSDGVQNRRKIRLRCYDTEDQTVKFEIKEKKGNYQHKSSLIISREEARAIQEGDYEVLLNYEGEIALSLYTKLLLGCYRPAALIEYDRRAFIYPEYQTRITFDTNVKTSEMETNLFEEEVAWTPVMGDRTILEVKYDQYLFHPISKVLEKHHLNQVSFSKYGNGRPIMATYM